jgi:Ca2+/Na+ antiporter
MQILQQILFVLISIMSIWFFTKKVKEISRNIRLGRDEDFSDNKDQRWKNVFAIGVWTKEDV